LNWRKILDPANGFQCLPFYDGTIGAKVIAVVAEDERTLKIVLDRPNAVFLDMLANVQCPVALLHPDSWDDAGRWRHPIGTGPYRLARWEKGRFVLLEKFEQYRPREEPSSGLAGAKHACVDRIRWLSITDLVAANAAVVSGQIDLNYGVAPVSALELERNSGVEVLKQPGAGRQVILVQRSGPLVGDLRIRRAIAHALDLELLAGTATLGLADANPSVVPEGSRAYSNAHRQWLAHDPGKAAALLEQAAYDGQPLVIRTTRSAQLLFDSAMIAQAMLREAGLNVRVEVMEWSALVAAYFEGDYTLMTFEYSPRLTPFLGYLAVIGTGNRSTYLWNDKIASNLLMKASQEPELARRYRLYEEIHRRMIEQIPAINVYDIPIIDVVSERLRGYSTWIGGTPRLWNVCLSNAAG
jgi:peptide/nickel transport system substrate-binding protein